MTPQANEQFTTAVAAFGLLVIVMSVILMAFEDGVPMGRLRKIRCKYGYHKMFVWYGGEKMQKYRCVHCKMPRKHPPLTVIDGGKKISDNKFNF